MHHNNSLEHWDGYLFHPELLSDQRVGSPDRLLNAQAPAAWYIKNSNTPSLLRADCKGGVLDYKRLR